MKRSKVLILSAAATGTCDFLGSGWPRAYAGLDERYHQRVSPGPAACGAVEQYDRCYLSGLLRRICGPKSDSLGWSPFVVLGNGQ